MATIVNRPGSPAAATVIKFANKVKAHKPVVQRRKGHSASPVVAFFRWLIEL